MRTFLITSMLFSLLLVGCGQSGALYHPKPSVSQTKATTPTAKQKS